MATCRRRGALLVNMCGFEFCRQTWFTTRKLRTCKWMPASTASWRAASLQWCTQHTITFFFSAALVGGRFEVHNDSIRRWVLRLVWFVIPVLLAACWSVSIAVSSASIPYGTTGDGTSIVIAVLAAAAPWFVTGVVVC